MKKIRLLNTSEYYAERAIRKALIGTRFRVFAQLPLNKVVQREEGESLSRGERTLLEDSELDFVIYDENSEPQFAIEFDGAAHQYEEQKKRDLRKNKICQRAGLPLLRITDDYVKEYDKTNIVEYVISRFVFWDHEQESLVNEMYENIAQLPDDVLQKMLREEVLDPSLDPSVLFDLSHPFPKSSEVAYRLWNNFGILTNYIDAQPENKDFLTLLERNTGMEFGDKFYATKQYELVRQENGKIVFLHKVDIKFGLQWLLPLEDDYLTEESSFSYLARTGKSQYAFQEIPGSSIPEIAEQMCEYLILCEIENWALENLPRIDAE